ncbi:prenyltransferase/squalene oxidase repeat-containing protein [Pontiellaceae bacterium B1224]|nr:prenyltransferase/squalene oxidase repeat-containing protein [Pontiellaceae bacterium B1224]
MTPLADRLIQSSACSRHFLEEQSLDKMAAFVKARQNPDGGFRGRDGESDLYYTVFAVACLKTLGYQIPVIKIWKFARSFGIGQKLDLVHLVCLIRIRTAFPMFGFTRRRLFQTLEQHQADSAYGLFLKLFAEDFRDHISQTEVALETKPSDPTPNLAAALIVGTDNAEQLEKALLKRAVESGGFAPSDQIDMPDLLSTATAVFALVSRGVNMDDFQKPCIKYAESLWRESGGFAGHAADEFEDVEYTFYALLTIGSLIKSMAKDYGN